MIASLRRGPAPVLTLAGLVLAAPCIALAAPTPAFSPTSAQLAKLAADMTSARSVTVEHVVTRTAPVRFYTHKPSERLVEVARFRRTLGADVAASFAAALGAADLDSLAKAPLPGCLGDPARHDRLMLTFGEGRRVVRSRLSFTDLIATISGADEKPGARIPIEARLPELRTLVGRALPDDSLLATMPPCFPAPIESLTAEPTLVVALLVDEMPEPTRRVRPLYPPAARRADISGTVTLEALIQEDGSVARTRVVQSITELDEEAVRAVEEWRFKPAKRQGKPVAVWVQVPVTFRLN